MVGGRRSIAVVGARSGTGMVGGRGRTGRCVCVCERERERGGGVRGVGCCVLGMAATLREKDEMMMD